MRDDGTRRDVRSPQPPRAVVLIRLLVGLVFFEEGIQKFLFPAVMGAGRFARIGIPAPEVMGPFVGVAEIACGALLMLGLRTRLAAVPLLVESGLQEMFHVVVVVTAEREARVARLAVARKMSGEEPARFRQLPRTNECAMCQ